MARPKKVIDEKLLEAMATSHLPNEHMANTLGISVWTLERRYAQKIQEYKSRGKAKLVMKAQQLAEKGNWPALKYLLGNHLNWSEKVEVQSSDNNPTIVTRVFDPREKPDDEK